MSDPKPISKVRVRLREQSWDFEIRMTLAEAFALKASTGLTPQQFLGGMNDLDPAAVQALIWLCHMRAGTAINIAEVPTDFDLLGDDFEMDDLTDPTPGAATPSVSAATS